MKTNASLSIAVLVAIMFVCFASAPASAQAPATPPPVSRLVPQVPPDVAAPPADAEKSDSGLAWKVLSEGQGTSHPGVDDMVTVNYSGWTTDGRLFDSTQTRGRPSTLPVRTLLPGWVEALQLMAPGEKRRLWVPEALAFRGAEGRPKGMIVFDIELLDFMPGPVTPVDVNKPPSDAQQTRSGLASRVLRPGTGKDRPRSSSTVKVHYSGWTTDGKMFDSSVLRAAPASFRLDEVIAGWTEGLQLMVAGERRRFWIPQQLAYKGEAGKPRGMLVFDVELLEIVER